MCISGIKLADCSDIQGIFLAAALRNTVQTHASAQFLQSQRSTQQPGNIGRDLWVYASGPVYTAETEKLFHNVLRLLCFDMTLLTADEQVWCHSQQTVGEDDWGVQFSDLLIWTNWHTCILPKMPATLLGICLQKGSVVTPQKYKNFWIREGFFVTPTPLLCKLSRRHSQWKQWRNNHIPAKS